ncbi:Lipoate-protein ligase A [compost metagenome]
MIAAFRNMYGQHLPIEYVNQTNLQPKTFEQLQSKQWIYGESPEFSITEERKLSFGNVTLSAEIENGRIQRMKIYTDSLYALEFVELEQRLIHTLFDSNEVFAQINEFVGRL